MLILIEIIFMDNLSLTEHIINVWDEPGEVFEDGPKLYDYLKQVLMQL